MELTRVVPIQDFSPATLRTVLAHLEASSSGHLVYREAELDALWSMLDVAIRSAAARGVNPEDLDELQSLFRAVTDAHNFVGDGDPAAAAARLRDVVGS